MAVPKNPSIVVGTQTLRGPNYKLRKPQVAAGTGFASDFFTNPERYTQDYGVPGMVTGDYTKIQSIPDYTAAALAPGGYAAPGAPPVSDQPAFDINGYQNEIEGDPVYKNALANFQAAIDAGRGSLRGAIQQAIIQGGFDPRAGAAGLGFNLGDYANDIDPATLEAATKNPLSARAQLETARTRGLANAAYALNARGMLRSGETATAGRGIEESYQAQANQQLTDLLQAIQGNIGNYKTLEANQRQSLLEARQSVADRLAQLAGLRYSATGDTGGGTSVAAGPGGVDVSLQYGLPAGTVYNVPAAPSVPRQDMTHGYVVGGGYVPPTPVRKKKR